MANGNEQFVYKPVSESDRKLAILLPASVPKGATVQIVDANGNVVSTGQNYGPSNGNRETFRFDRPGGAFGSNFSIQISAGDDSYTVPIEQGGARYTSQGLSSENLQRSGGGGNVSFGETAQGSQFVVPSGQDFSQVSPQYVDYPGTVDYAYGVGELNKDIYFGNVSGEQAKRTAMGLLRTDIEGIKMGAEELGPVVRQAGRQDVQENIQRAGDIDRFNLSRIPGFNEFNIAQARQATRARQEARTEAVEGAGLGFKERMTKLLDQLSVQSEGRLSPELDKMLTEESRNRAAELAGTTGVSSISGAGVRGSDRLMISERLGIQSAAQQMIPGVLGQAQQTLQAPEEIAPMIYAQPTGVPLTVSNIQDRLPVQASISAGQAQKALGTEATSLQTISPTTILGQNLATQQYNENSRYRHEWGVLEQEQNAQNAVETAYQNAINADKQDAVRQDALDAYYAGLEKREASQEAEAARREEGVAVGTERARPISITQTETKPDGTITRTYSNGSVTTTKPDGTVIQTKAPVAQRTSVNSQDRGTIETIVQGAETLSTVAGGYANAADALLAIGDKWFGDGDGKVKIGSAEITAGQFSDYVDYVRNGFTGEQTTTTEDGTPTNIKGKDVVGYETDDQGNLTGYTLEDGTSISKFETDVAVSNKQSAPSIYQKITQGLEDAGLDWKTLGKTASTIEGWGSMSNAQKLDTVGSLGADILENQGVIDSDTAEGMKTVANALSTLANPNASDAQKFSAMANATKDITMTPYTGNINEPKTISGKPVVGSTTMKDGSQGFQILNNDGSVDVVSKQDLINTANTGSAISAFSVLMSNAEDEQKVKALAAIGIDAAAANGIINQVTAGNTLAALSIFNTAQNWDKMSNFQRGVAVLQTGGPVLDVASTLTNSATQAGTTTLAKTGTQQVGQAGAQQVGQIGTQQAGQQAGQTGAQAGAESAGSTLGTISSLAGYAMTAIGWAMATKNTYETMQYSKDAPKSQSEKDVILSQIASGVTVGSTWGPIGAAIGGVIGIASGIVMSNTGTGKGSGQAQRDGWRQGLESQGLVENPEGTNEFNVTLADGSTYDIGKDGTETKLQNKKGTNPDGTPSTRYTFDVDWSNDAAVASIPKAHLFTIASGLDPTTNEGKDLFHRTSAQSLNAATSNANDVESINANYKAMLEKGGVDAGGLAMKVEVLRAENKITDQEYNTYISGINEIYGTQLQPSDRQEAFNYIVNSAQEAVNNYETNYEKYDKLYDTNRKQYNSIKNHYEGNKRLLETLTNPKQLASWDRARRKRNKEEVINMKGVIRPGGISDRDYNQMITDYMIARRYQRRRSRGARG